MAAPRKREEYICSLCNLAEDEEEGDRVWWIECSSTLCNREYHLSCVGLTKETLPKKRDPWYCPFCEKKGIRRSKRQSSSQYRRLSEEQQPDLANEGVNQFNSLREMEEIQVVISRKYLPPLQGESTTGKNNRNFISFLFLALIGFILGYLFVSYQDFNTFVRY